MEAGVANLHALAGKIDIEATKAPAFLMVLTAVGEFAYRRRDGVWVCPLGALRS